MHKLFWLIPIALIILMIWLPSLLAASVLAIIGWAVLSLGGIVLVGFFVVWLIAAGMAS